MFDRKAWYRTYYLSHLEERRLCRNKSRAKHPETAKLWRETHRDSDRAASKRWRMSHREHYRQIQHNHEANRRGAPGSFTVEEWNDLKARYNYTCPSCSRREPDVILTQDHIIPVTQPGSTNYISNIQPLCRQCNSAKGTKTTQFSYL